MKSKNVSKNQNTDVCETPLQPGQAMTIAWPTQEELINEMRLAIENSVELQAAIEDLSAIRNKKRTMETAIEDYNRRESQLTLKKEEITAAFGDNPDSDFKDLDDVRRELGTIEEAKKLLTHRLRIDGEIDLAVRDCINKVEHLTAVAMSSVTKKYQPQVNDFFDGFVEFLNNFTSATSMARSLKTKDGVSIRTSSSSRDLYMLQVDDVLRLRPYSFEFAAMQMGAISRAQNMAQ